MKSNQEVYKLVDLRKLYDNRLHQLGSEWIDEHAHQGRLKEHLLKKLGSGWSGYSKGRDVYISHDKSVGKALEKTAGCQVTEDEADKIVEVGFLHVEMASQECGGKLLAASGWERMFSMANIFLSGVTASLLGGKHVKRTRYAYHLTLAFLHVLKLRAYKEYCTGYGPHEPTDVWEQRLIDASPTISYWTTVREYLLINCHFVKGQQQGDWPLTLSACEDLCSWFFVFGHTNYARWLPVFLQNMA
ncbi:hypothetical protein ACOMHN_019890 [Nucella lapillus]